MGSAAGQQSVFQTEKVSMTTNPAEKSDEAGQGECKKEQEDIRAEE